MLLRRWFLILDEIEIDRGRADFANIMNVRNFVSHYFCDKNNVIKLINKELPQAICQDSVRKKEARFDRRNSEHILFVEKYVRMAENRVKKLLESML
ncbi:MAG: hypothetical protein D3917_19615 [Candidatus Electrothrix sp. AX5]|nr:hypothetical protein [Candidatus Electrothrix sp. AX5]